MYLCICEREAEKGDFGSCFRHPFHRTQPAAFTNYVRTRSAHFRECILSLGTFCTNDPPYSSAKLWLALNFGQRARFGFSCLSLCLLISVPRSGLMDDTYIKATARLRGKMASHSLPSPTSFRGTSHPISTAQPWQSCTPVIRRARRSRKLNRSRNWPAESVNVLG
jgi:hypothetical protein